MPLGLGPDQGATGSSPHTGGAAALMWPGSVAWSPFGAFAKAKPPGVGEGGSWDLVARQLGPCGGGANWQSLGWFGQGEGRWAG